MNDIQYVVKDTKIKLFADDTNLFLYNTDVDKLFEIANMNMSQWFTVNKLNLNLDKTCYSTFHTNCVDLNKFKLHMDGKETQRVESCKYLGILNANRGLIFKPGFTGLTAFKPGYPGLTYGGSLLANRVL